MGSAGVVITSVMHRHASDQEERALEVLDELEERRQEGGCLSCGGPMAETDAKCAACGWTYL